MSDKDNLMIGDKKLGDLRVVDLKAELEKRGLSKYGAKKDLADRLYASIMVEMGQEGAAECPTNNDDELPNIAMQDKLPDDPLVREYLTSQAELFHSQKVVQKLYREEQKRESEGSGASADEREKSPGKTPTKPSSGTASPSRHKDRETNSSERDKSSVKRSTRNCPEVVQKSPVVEDTKESEALVEPSKSDESQKDSESAPIEIQEKEKSEAAEVEKSPVQKRSTRSRNTSESRRKSPAHAEDKINIQEITEESGPPVKTDTPEDVTIESKSKGEGSSEEEEKNPVQRSTRQRNPGAFHKSSTHVEESKEVVTNLDKLEDTDVIDSRAIQEAKGDNKITDVPESDSEKIQEQKSVESLKSSEPAQDSLVLVDDEMKEQVTIEESNEPTLSPTNNKSKIVSTEPAEEGKKSKSTEKEKVPRERSSRRRKSSESIQKSPVPGEETKVIIETSSEKHVMNPVKVRNLAVSTEIHVVEGKRTSERSQKISVSTPELEKVKKPSKFTDSEARQPVEQRRNSRPIEKENLLDEVLDYGEDESVDIGELEEVTLPTSTFKKPEPIPTKDEPSDKAHEEIGETVLIEFERRVIKIKPNKHSQRRKEKFEEEKKDKESKSPEEILVTVEFLNRWYQNVEILTEEELKLDENPPPSPEPSGERKLRITRTISNVDTVGSTSPHEDESGGEEDEKPPQHEMDLTIQRKISIISMDEEVVKEQTPPRRAPTQLILVTNLVRPFTVPQLKELLQRTGNVVDLWVDKIKSKCVAKYDTEDESIETRTALHGVRWPMSNPKSLSVDFTTEERVADLRKKDSGYVEEKPVTAQHVREWDVGKRSPRRKKSRSPEQDRDRDRKRHRRSSSRGYGQRRHSRSPHSDRKERNGDIKKESSGKTLDELFRKTVATPCIYWLPLNPQQIAEKEELRRKRMEERERRMAELQYQRSQR